MGAVVEVPELESWFLVQWRGHERPDVLMEFESQAEAEAALASAFADMVIRLDERPPWLPITVCSVLSMLADPSLRDALAAWDTQLAELSPATRRTSEERS
jgi:hypothetical protein